MIGLVATLRVHEGQAELFEDIFRDIMDLVRTEEPGALVYQLTKSRTEPNTYKVLELYQDQTALDAHGASEAIRAAMGKITGCIAGRPEIEYLDAVI